MGTKENSMLGHQYHTIHSLEHIELPVHIVSTPQATLSSKCVSALTHLPEILLEEEMESYSTSQQHCTDLLSSVHNTGGIIL